MNIFYTLVGKLLVLAALLSGCTAINDLNRFQTNCDGDLSKTRDFNAVLSGMEEFDTDGRRESDRIEVRIVNNDFEIVSRAVIYGHSERDEGNTVAIPIPRAIPPGEHTVHIFYKEPANGLDIAYDPQTDPSWIREMCPSGFFEFEADNAFQVINDPPTTDVGNRFAMEMVGLTPHSDGNQKMELQVIDQTSNRAVIYFRLAGLEHHDIAIGVPGQIVPNREYAIEFYFDKNQNGHYDGFPTDHSWRLDEEMVGGPLGLLLIGENAWVHDTTFATVDFQ